MIHFKGIKIIGFGSIKKLEFSFDNEGIHVIKGKNGTGKTSILNALFWTIYGKTLKEGASVELWEWMRTDEYKGAMVEIDLDKDGEQHYITRFANYKGKYNGSKGNNRVILSGSDKTHKKEVQKEINELIGVSPELFKSSILFGQKMKRIIEDSGADKKKVLEQCFDHSRLDTIIADTKIDKEKVDKLLLDLHNKITDLEYTEKTLENDIQSINDKYENSHGLYRNDKQHLTDRLKDLEPYIEKYKAKKKELKKLKAESDKSDIDILIANVATAVEDIENKQKEISSLRHKQISRAQEIEALDKDPICKTCGQEIQDIPVKKIKELTKAFHKDEKPLSDLINTEKSLRDKLKECRTKELEYYNRLTGIDSLTKTLKESEPKKIRKTLKEKLSLLIEPKKEDTAEQLGELNAVKEQIKKKVKELKTYTKNETFYDWLLKDPLSNKGIKAYMFDMLLEDINDHLTKYSHILGYRVEFSINYDRANKDIILNVYDTDNNAIPYSDLSGGQGQIINVATALAFHDLVNTNIPFNILILDEVFESLDSDNIEKVNSLLEIKSTETSIIIITHQESFNPRSAQITNLRLVEGLTSVA